MSSVFDNLPQETQDEINARADLRPPFQDTADPKKWDELRRDLKNAPFPPKSDELSADDLKKILAASKSPPGTLPGISNDLILALSQLASGDKGALPGITSLLSSLIADPETRRLVNGLLNTAVLLSDSLAQGISGANAFALLLPIFQMLGAEGVVVSVADAFAKANMANAILSGDLTGLLSAVGLFGDLSPVQQQALKGTIETLKAAGFARPFADYQVESGPPGVYVNSMHIATLGSPTACGAKLAPGPGSSDVTAYGKPVFRYGDAHVCPLTPAHIHGPAKGWSDPHVKVTVNGEFVVRDKTGIYESGITSMVAINKQIVAVSAKSNAPWDPSMAESSGIEALDSVKEAASNVGDLLVKGVSEVLDPFSEALSDLWDALGMSKEPNASAPEAIGNCGPQMPGINNLILLTMSMGGMQVSCTPHELLYGRGADGYSNQRIADDELDEWLKKQFATNPLAGAIARIIMRPGYNTLGTLAYPRGNA